MAQHDPSQTDATLFKVLIAAGGAVSVWIANRYGLLTKRKETDASREQHALDVAVAERGKTIDGLWVIIEDLRDRLKELETERDDQTSRIDELHEERITFLRRVNEIRLILTERDHTLKMQAVELTRCYDRQQAQSDRIERLEQQVKALGEKPVNGGRIGGGGGIH